MTGSPSNQDLFDLRKIRRLVELINEHDLTEIDLRQGDTRVRIRRGRESAGGGTARPAVVAAPAAPAPTPSPEPPRPAQESTPKEDYVVLI